MLKSYQIKITTMWCKVNELSEKGLKNWQISLLLGIHRQTVRKYRGMSREEFEHLLKKPYHNRTKKLGSYVDFVSGLLSVHPYLTSPQILDRLKETYGDELPYVSDKTVYNFVEAIRKSHSLPKEKEAIRQMSKLPDPAYGKEAQVDWGEKKMMTSGGHWKKVYFFVMVMSRSRQKFVHFQEIPFTALTTVYAHHLAFEFFGGVPERLVYDQDVKLIVSENLGDFILTKEMESFRKTAGFTPVFCRPSDPQSKGKVENAVGYVKNNFIKGRLFTTIDSLNVQALEWLERTGNGHVHATTRLVPALEFEKERPHLLPYNGRVERPVSQGRPYTVRRDNTISYHSCFYQLPKGSYAGDGTRVRLVESSDNEIEIYSIPDGEFIIRYTVSAVKGKYVEKSDVRMVDRRDVSDVEKNLTGRYLSDKAMSGKLGVYLDSLREERPRYYNASVRILDGLFEQLPVHIASMLLDTLIGTGTTNAYDAVEIADSLLVRNNLAPLKKAPSRYGRRGRREAPAANLEPQRNDITSYETIINEISKN